MEVSLVGGELISMQIVFHDWFETNCRFFLALSQLGLHCKSGQPFHAMTLPLDQGGNQTISLNYMIDYKPDLGHIISGIMVSLKTAWKATELK